MTTWRPLLIAIALGLTTVLSAQAEDRRPFAWDVTRAVLIDRTTYVPALISHEAIRQDWKTSQVERIVFASILTYSNSADHFRQAFANRCLAREHGYATQ